MNPHSTLINSLAAKPFVILTGNSGTGKTKLAELFAEWLCGDKTDRMALVPVGADWTDNRNVLGFVNHLRLAPPGSPAAGAPVYQSTVILDLLLAAAAEPKQPFFLILDEMNLSHVERYFADFLSAMESRDGVLHLHREGQKLPRKPGEPADVPETLPLPRNVFVIGTVNVDETTYMFSPKVLDRANVIEFRVESDAPKAFFASGGAPLKAITPAPAGYAEGFLDLSFRARGLDGAAPLELTKTPNEGLNQYHAVIEDLFGLMQKSYLEFGYRPMAEMVRYLAVDFELCADKPNWKSQEAMDAQIIQKILPKLHGSKRKLGPLLAALAAYCETGKKAAAESVFTNQAAADSYPAEGTRQAVFKDSHRKLCQMIIALRRDQFVSFIQ